MKPYPSYKDSGVEWIGEIPMEWDVISIKRLSIVKRGSSPRPIDNQKYFDGEGEFHWVRISDVTSSERYLEKTTQRLSELGSSLSTKRYPDDLILSIAGSVGKPIITKIKCCIHDGFVWFDNLKFNHEYLYYIFRIGQCFQGLGKFGTQLNLNTETVGTIKIPNIGINQQQQISNFLDQKTKQIDDLIEKTKKKIKLLKEKRTSLINHCVTKGLDPNMEMKDSGVEWIGEIPRGWVVSKFKYDSLTPVRYGINISGDRYIEEGIRFIRITDLNDSGVLNPSKGKYLIDSDVGKEFLLDKYDVLFCRSGHTVGKSYLHLEDGKYTSGGYLVRFNFGNHYQSKFIFYISKSHFYEYWVRLNTITSTIENVNGEKYSNMEYPKPPLPEQQQIVTHLDQETQKIDTLIEKENERIDLLKEYRQSLISEVVTGKIDVRDEVLQ